MDKKQNKEKNTELMKFAEIIKAECDIQFAGEKKAHIVESRKSNTLTLTGISITEGTSIISPVFYLEPFYGQYLCGRSIKDIAGEIINRYNEHTETKAWDVSFLADYEKCAPHIRASLINYENNTKILTDIPHRKFVDLAVVYHMETNIPRHSEMNGVIKINNTCMDLWNIQEKDLYAQSLENMACNSVVTDLDEMLKKYLPAGMSKQVILPTDKKVLVLTNKKILYGAAMLLLTGELDSICAELHAQQLAVIPSSIHEVILFAYEEEGDLTELSKTIVEVNRKDLEPTEVLSEHPYIYDSRTKELSIWHEP